MKKFIQTGCSIPNGYGIAYRRIDMDGAIAFPIPINIFVAIGKRIHDWLAWGHRLFEDGYSEGFSKGWNAGFQSALRDSKEILALDLIKKFSKD